MSNNSSNTVIYKSDIDIILPNYIILKCDNIKASLLEEIKQKTKIEGREFILIREFDADLNLAECINYLHPSIPKILVSSHLLLNAVFEQGNKIVKSILFFAGLKEAPDDFILSIYAGRMQFTYFEPSNLIEKLDSHISIEDEYFGNRVFAIISEEDIEDDLEDENIKIDELTKKRVIELTKQIDILKESGDYLTVLPMIEAYLLKIDDTKLIQVSSVLINPEYKIFLPDFNNLEVKLNSLTKSIYLLFLNHPEGILLSKLILYKSELMEYYLGVSNREDYDLMKERIDKIIDLKSNEIYVHLSRIN